jgi:CPA1 family monovalent cation:H+ antiporter
MDAGGDDAASRMGPIPPGMDGDDDGRRPMGQLEMIAVSDDIDLTQRSPIIRHREATRLRLAILDRKREVLLRLRREGTIDDLVARRILADLDIEEIRARGMERAAD